MPFGAHGGELRQATQGCAVLKCEPLGLLCLLRASTRPPIRASRWPQKKIFEPEFTFAGRDGSVATTTGDPTVNGLRPSFRSDDLIECVATRAIEINYRVLGQDTRSNLSPKVHYSRPQMPGHSQAAAIVLVGPGRRESNTPLPRPVSKPPRRFLHFRRFSAPKNRRQHNILHRKRISISSLHVVRAPVACPVPFQVDPDSPASSRVTRGVGAATKD